MSPPRRYSHHRTSRVNPPVRQVQYIAPAAQRPESESLVYVRQDTPPVEEFIWSMPRPSSGRLHPPIPPRFEPVLYMQPTLTGLETPCAMPTTLSPAPKLANSLSFARVPRIGGVDHTTNCVLDDTSEAEEMTEGNEIQGNETNQADAKMRDCINATDGDLATSTPIKGPKRKRSPTTTKQVTDALDENLADSSNCPRPKKVKRKGVY